MSLILRALSHRSLQTAFLLRHISTTKLPCARAQQKPQSASVAKSEPRGDVGEAKPIGERVKETAKTTSYLGVIVAGIAVTAVMFYTIFSELFSSNSPQAIYGKALEKCQEHPRVQDSLGQPIKGYGEESSRRRRNHVAHQIYMRNNRKCMRLSFHIQGIRNKATVHCEMRENNSGDYEYRYLFVQLDSYPHTTIIIEDNRASDSVDDDEIKPTSLTGILNN